MSKLLCKVLKFWGDQMTKCPPDCAPALFDTVVKSRNCLMLPAYSSIELNLVDDWASTFSQLYILKQHCFFGKLS